MIPCECVSNEELDRLILERKPVHKRSPECNNRTGFVRNRAHGFNIDGVFHRFPHLEIFPVLTGIESIRIPLWNRAFSRGGDSGSWVFAENTDKWLGMVVGGDEYFLSTFVAESAPLLDYFRLSGRDFGESSFLNPYTFG
jgi:hypothetical protein